MPKTETVAGVMNSAYSQPLPSPIKYSQEYEELQKDDAIPEGEKLSDAEVLEVVNTRRRNAARQKGMNAALEAAGIAKPTLADSKVQLAQIVKALVASGKTAEEAEAIAKGVLGL